MPKSDDLQMQSGASLKSARKRIQQRKDGFTHGSWNIVPSELNFNANNATEFSVRTGRSAHARAERASPGFHLGVTKSFHLHHHK